MGARRAAGGPACRVEWALRRLRVELDATEAQVCLAWLLGRSPVMVPVPGTASIAHLQENVAATGLTLGDDQRRRLDGVAGRE